MNSDEPANGRMRPRTRASRCPTQARSATYIHEIPSHVFDLFGQNLTRVKYPPPCFSARSAVKNYKMSVLYGITYFVTVKTEISYFVTVKLEFVTVKSEKRPVTVKCVCFVSQ